MRGNDTAIAAALATGPINSGWYVGMEVYRPGHPPTIYPALALVAVAILLIGAVVSATWMRSSENPGNPLLCCCLVGYALATIFFEPFLHVGQVDAVLLAVTFLTPGLIAMFSLVHRQEWISLAGLLLFLFVGFAMLSSNVHTSKAGSGFYNSWIS